MGAWQRDGGHSVIPARQWFFSETMLQGAAASLLLSGCSALLSLRRLCCSKWRPRLHRLEPSCCGSSCITDVLWLFFPPFSYSGVVPGSDCVLGVCDAAPALGPRGPSALASCSCLPIPILPPTLMQDLPILSLNFNLENTCFDTAESPAFLPGLILPIWSQCSHSP